MNIKKIINISWHNDYIVYCTTAKGSLNSLILLLFFKLCVSCYTQIGIWAYICSCVWYSCLCILWVSSFFISLCFMAFDIYFKHLDIHLKMLEKYQRKNIRRKCYIWNEFSQHPSIMPVLFILSLCYVRSCLIFYAFCSP